MHGGDASGAFLTEATFDITPRHALFGRVETVDNEELLAAPDPLAGRNLIVAKATIGYGVKPAIQCSSRRRAESTFGFTYRRCRCSVSFTRCLHNAFGFWTALMADCLPTVVLYLAMTVASPRLGIRL